MRFEAAPHDFLEFREFGTRHRFRLESESIMLRDIMVESQRLTGSETVHRSVDESSILPIGGLLPRVACVPWEPDEGDGGGSSSS